MRFQTVNKFSGKITSDTGFFPNTILNDGRNIMATETYWMDHCQVGTDNTAPTQNDTTLAGYIDGTSTVMETTSGQNTSPPYYGWKRRRFRFDAGPIGGENLKEAGVGWGLSGATIMSRALILDPILHTPTTITPLADEFLDVTYELRYYPPLIDVTTPQVTLDGVDYDTITRAAGVTGIFWSDGIGNKIGPYTFDNNTWNAYDDDIGTILTGPTGVNTGSGNATQYASGVC